MTDYEAIVDALDSVTWYNGLAEYVYRWTLPGAGYLKRPNGTGYLTRTRAEDLDPRGEGQLEVIWMICVNLFGDYGTSPRSGWIEKEEEFYAFCKEITTTWRESEEGQAEMEAILCESHEPNGRCFWCGKDKAGGSSQDSKWINGDYEPCDECKADMKKGITVVEASETPVAKGQLPYHGAYPTGNWFVITEKGIRKVVDWNSAEEAIARKMLLAEHEAYAEITDRIKMDLKKGEDGNDRG